jgi:hypothetical protein
MAKPSYPKDMKERAKKDGKKLITVDVPGFCFQGPATNEEVSQLMKLITSWLQLDKV